jgi:sugar O-acyltransferase (sialic acid O-acetyltransferase NeuD family)
MSNYIYGAGGHGKVVLDAMQHAGINCAGFVDDKEILKWSGISVFQLSELELETKKAFHLAIGDCKIRESIVTRFGNVSYFSVIHTSVALAKSAKVGLGTFLAAHSVLAPDSKIGNHCIINHAAVVDHDCVVGDYCHIAPQCSLGGGVKVGKGVLIGSGAVVLPGVSIDDYAIVGAGAVVLNDVAKGTKVVGNPARLIYS